MHTSAAPTDAAGAWYDQPAPISGGPCGMSASGAGACAGAGAAGAVAACLDMLPDGAAVPPAAAAGAAAAACVNTSRTGIGEKLGVSGRGCQPETRQKTYAALVKK